MKCPRCRVENKDDANYCRGCGMPLKRQSPGWASATPPKAPPPVPTEMPKSYQADADEEMEVPDGVRYFDPPPASHVTPPYGTPEADQEYSSTYPPSYPQTPPAMMGYAPQTYTAYAGFWLRFVAYIIDNIILSIGAGCVGGIVGAMIGVSYAAGNQNLSQAQISELELVANIVGYVIGVLIGWLYYAMMESSGTQATLGKMALGLRVTDMEGQRISFGRASGRYFGKYLSILTLLIGFIVAGFTEKKQALHDILAGCLVFRKA